MLCAASPKLPPRGEEPSELIPPGLPERACPTAPPIGDPSQDPLLGVTSFRRDQGMDKVLDGELVGSHGLVSCAE